MLNKEEINKEIEKLNLKIGDLRSQNAAFEQETERLTNLKSEYTQEILSLKDSLENLREDIVKTKELAKSLKDSNKKLAERKDSLCQSIDALDKSLGEKTLKLDEVSKNLENGEKKLSEVEKLTSEQEVLLETKLESLKGFEQELSMREALVDKRSQELDLQIKGIKLDR